MCATVWVCARVLAHVGVGVSGAKQFYYGSLTKGSLVLLFDLSSVLPPLFDKHFEPPRV